jgi:hypothetical protein
MRRKLISYVTDLEGDLKFFQRFLESSKILTATNVVHSVTEPTEWKAFDIDFLKQEDKENVESHFVFGGDLFDHGPGDLRMAQSLLNFKQKYPSRVTLLTGNRDLNKLRLLNELSSEHLNYEPNDPRIFEPYWKPRKLMTTYSEHLELISQITKKQQPQEVTHGPIDFVPKSWRKKKVQDIDSKNDAPSSSSSERNIDTPVERLKWILKHTMGSNKAFEYRRHELSVLEEDNNNTVITDDQVFNSFFRSIQMSGLLQRYLKETEIMKIHGETLYVHGALTEKNIGKIPNTKRLCNNAIEWSNYLNNWKNNEFQKWYQLPMKQKVHSKSNKFPLLDYGVQDGNNCTSVVYNSWLKKKNRYPKEHKSTSVNQFLLNSSVKRVIVGHQPHGDIPTILKGNDFYVILSDTTYCNGSPGDWHSRGTSCVEIIVEEMVNERKKEEEEDDDDYNEGGKNNLNSVVRPLPSICNIHGLFNDGSVSSNGDISFDFIVEEHPQLGCELKDQWFVGHPLENREEYVLWQPKPGAPFPSDLNYKVVPYDVIRNYNTL